jgi:Alkaline phosphatase PhoX
MKTRAILALGGLLALGAAAAAVAAPGSETGPSSSQAPYLVRSKTGVVTKSILTTGDSVGGYTMGGIPDGLGAYDNGNGTFTLLSNHEIPSAEGAVRAHGARGAYVSEWVIDKDDLSVVSGQDLIQHVNVWDPATSSWTVASGDAAPNRLNRLCSADLAPISAYYNAATGKGYNGRIFTDGEESNSPPGRPFGHVVGTGESYELTPWIGTMAFENVVANPSTGDTTTVMALDDSTPGQVYMHVGTKTDTGNEVQKAGLANGKLYGVKVSGVPQNEVSKTDWAVGEQHDFSLEDVSANAAVGGSAPGSLEADSVAAGVTGFQRPEDGSWDPSHPSDFYFVTTSNFGPNSAGTLDGHTRLWRLRFDDPADPSQGGSIKLLVNGSIGTPDSGGGTQSASATGPQMMDNITVDARGQVIIEEDVGNQSYRGGVWVYDTSRGSLTRVAIADPALFTPGAPGFLTKDEEASGVIPAPFLEDGAYLLDEQVHKTSSDPALVEGGQFMELHIPPKKGG